MRPPKARLSSLCAALSALALPAAAQDIDAEMAAFVQSNVLGIFYHELGHALIDIEDVPIFGQEEDAADVFSVVMTVTVFEPDRVEELAYDYALGFDAEARMRDADGAEISWASVHGPDEQRFYNTVCLFYGANEAQMKTFAEDMGLPEERADYCWDEFAQALDAWGGILDRVIDRGPGDSLSYTGPDDGLIGEVLSEEIAALNAEMTLSQPLTVHLEPCGEANAFYDPQAVEVVFCTEFEDHLIRAAEETLR